MEKKEESDIESAIKMSLAIEVLKIIILGGEAKIGCK